ncbi:DinB family protein [Paenibacillus koleovorans]|uniref:DinB family protein n=1 Tax=Paenibacillus koleovorans TaxID=121608 RepID=UPI000FDCD390|nr:DinB family protein [Paenibacillus koleovorans]
MNAKLVTDWMIAKFQEIEKRWLAAIEQLSEEQLNWRPNEESNSIANLVVHIRGNVAERVSAGILGEPPTRDRDAEFALDVRLAKPELQRLVRESFQLLTGTIAGMSPDQLEQTQSVRGKQRTHLDVLLASAAHFSEHLGQVLYIAKLILDERYVTTSIPRAKP